jgi:hypothetical protein
MPLICVDYMESNRRMSICRHNEFGNLRKEDVAAYFKVISSHFGIAQSGYGLDDRGVGVRVPVGSRIFTSRSRPDRLWSPHSLLSNGYRTEFFPGVKATGA